MDRNLLLFLALTVGTLVIWEVLIIRPQQVELQAQRELAEQQAATQETADSVVGNLGNTSAITSDVMSRSAALEAAPGRVQIETPSLTGSINLQGARFDDLRLKKYRETIDDDSDIITLFSPRETEFGHYAQQGLLTNAGDGRREVWSAPEGARLTTDTPVTLTRTQNGLDYAMTISVDQDYMFTIEQAVTNNTDGAISVAPYGLTVQRGKPPFLKNFMILHEGPVGVIGTTLHERKYNNVYKPNKEILESGTGGWVGLTSKNWLAAVIPDQSLSYRAELGHEPNTTKDRPVFNSLYRGDETRVEAGTTYTNTSYIFAGAKRVDILKSYEKPVEDGGLGIRDFDKAVDWGNFFFLTRPIFTVMHFFAVLTGNYGVAILLLTIVVKLLLFPLANKSYASMANMRKVAPELTKIRERYETDKMKQQQEMMALYKKHNINPLAGCWPMLIQMPVFYALYKVLFVTIETRHEQFLYIQDLADSDPAMIFNLFGLLPYDPSAIPVLGFILGIGLLPLLMGATMWVQMRLNPPPTDPVQAQVFAFMPIIFMFIMAPFAAGLVLYWFWNTFLGVLQQYYIMKKHGTEVDLLGNIKATLSGKTQDFKTENESSSTNLFGKSPSEKKSDADKKSENKPAE
ncbi:MAG: membrane protein insertase YidC [Aquisalinus sp.]|nr:membrane protein insertase YidC [Aquisalinus sp.]